MTPEKIGDDWFVLYRERREDRRAGPFKTNSEAWRWIERYQGEPISKSEERGDWIFGQMAGGKGL